MTEKESQVAGRYRLLKPIGRGGMGTVWLADDELLGRRVALKKLHVRHHLADDELAVLHERTRREARSAARITHPNVVVVHDVVDDEGLPCVVMEYVPSRTLGDLLKEQGTVTPAEAAGIGRAMLAALRAAHAAGVLHRDVKPGNVLLGDDGRVVLTDFGIATASGTSTLTRTGELVGSIDYVAPERVRGRTPGPASDLWALGATLYQAVEGRPPFRKDTAIETAYSIAADPVVPPRRAGSLAPLIEALLAKDPLQRPAPELVEQLLRLSTAEPESASVERGWPSAQSPAAPAEAVGEVAGEAAAKVASAPAPVSATDQEAGAGAGADAGGASGNPTPPLGTASGRSGRRRRAAGLIAATAVLAVAAVVTVAVLSDGDGRPRPRPKGQTGKPAPTSATSALPVPDGYHLVHEKELRVAFPVPDGWTRAVPHDADETNEIAYVDPSGLVGLRVSVLDFAGSDPLQHWKDDETESAREGKLPGYRKLRMQRTVFRDTPAAIWEFTWDGRARSFRASHLGFGRPGENEYAVYLSAPKADWHLHEQIFDDLRSGIRLPAERK